MEDVQLDLSPTDPIWLYCDQGICNRFHSFGLTVLHPIRVTRHFLAIFYTFNVQWRLRNMILGFKIHKSGITLLFRACADPLPPRPTLPHLGSLVHIWSYIGITGGFLKSLL